MPEAMSLTMPQIMMWVHASKVNLARNEERRKNREAANAKTDAANAKDPVVMNGKRLSQLTSDELAAYYRDMHF